ncbi:MAG: hypothetical protein PHH24_00825 [Candidatus Moranbacteria bacterium]|jgi:hypothetical protein|nr:hypothetical protein [Candidatus Moranbacteria bacterium]MDD5651789.1 hypothetical protein [Candidatus Moranbacteria bacterium]MDX9855800.1 hypothetical protein [Candidatus Moranbacteria bacterium]
MNSGKIDRGMELILVPLCILIVAATVFHNFPARNFFLVLSIVIASGCAMVLIFISPIVSRYEELQRNIRSASFSSRDSPYCNEMRQRIMEEIEEFKKKHPLIIRLAEENESEEKSDEKFDRKKSYY